MMKRENWLVFPLPGLRPVSKLIPETYRREFQEACQVLPTSPKASAALSRRCLQLLLRECAKVTRSNLAAEIDEVLQRKELPSHLAEAVDAVRIYGNFAAHPTKSENTGAIIDVEPGEAEWLLEVLEGLFDFYILQPAKLKARQEQLKAKMESAKKTARPPSKGRRLRPSTPLPAPQTEQN